MSTQNLLVVPNSAELVLLKMLLNITSPSDPKLKLYSNEVELNGNTVLGDFTECSSGTGYVAKTLNPINWSVTIDEDEKAVAVAEYDEQEFTFSVAQNIYGYFVTDDAETELLWAQEAVFAPVELPDGGGKITVLPRLTLHSQNND
jgi:hypothetical protein